ncbi:MAG: HlyD family efflux transporter periplasmic adaptor subunit [Flavobacteriaceae bacterium]|nr:HlyD family efflux transporter periplasmic adaptor subunit [Bacteroidia bacterium]NNL60172.1 HlyD family efflux transporter periplasmic adaptor subunit [Flavobacteriaceae bacterium]
MRKIILSVLGILLIIGAFFGAKTIIANKNKPKPRINKVVKTVFVQEVQNKSIPISIPANGNLQAMRRIELFSEVQGVFKNTGKPFKEGQRYNAGQTLVRIDASEYYASVQSAKSNLYNLIASIMPDLRLDYPNAYAKWQNYLNDFDLSKTTPELPDTSSEQEKFFITGRNIISTYYNVKNLEERLSKYSIRAPFTGILTEVLVTEGSLVRNGQKLGEYIDTRVYELEVAIPAAYADLLQLGKEVKLFNIDKTKSYNGKVVRINGSVNPTSQTVSAFVQVNDADLREGMYMEASLMAKEEKDAFEISRNLLQPNNEVFYVSNDTLLNSMTVEPLYFSEDNVVLRGIPNGTKILAKNIPGAYAGMLVKIYVEADNQTKPGE